jgi:hypothetical protein
MVTVVCDECGDLLTRTRDSNLWCSCGAWVANQTGIASDREPLLPSRGPVDG